MYFLQLEMFTAEARCPFWGEISIEHIITLSSFQLFIQMKKIKFQKSRTLNCPIIKDKFPNIPVSQSGKDQFISCKDIS